MSQPIGPELYAFIGLSTDTKPPKAIIGQRAVETDTGKVFEWRGNESGTLGGWVKPSLDVNLQDQVTRPIIAKFNEVSDSTTLSVVGVKGAYTITVANTTGFTAGKYIILFHPGTENFSFYTQMGAVAGNVVTLDTPLDFAYPVGTFADAAITDMAVDGSSTPRVFGLRGTGAPPGVDISADITRIIFNCISSVIVDLSTFAGLVGGLSRGIVLRRRDGTIQNIFNAKTNSELAGIMFDHDIYAALNPVQGVDGFVARLTFAGQNKIGVAVRLPIGDDLEIVVQDDLATAATITSLEVLAEGHIVEDPPS